MLIEFNMTHIVDSNRAESNSSNDKNNTDKGLKGSRQKLSPLKKEKKVRLNKTKQKQTKYY